MVIDIRALNAWILQPSSVQFPTGIVSDVVKFISSLRFAFLLSLFQSQSLTVLRLLFVFNQYYRLSAIEQANEQQKAATMISMFIELIEEMKERGKNWQMIFDAREMYCLM